MRIIVAMDIIGGKCVRLTRGDFTTKKIYNEDPMDVARQMEDNGLTYLHIVDLDGARNKKLENIGVLEKIAARTGLRIDYGGGIRSSDNLQKVIDAGACQVTPGTIAVNDPELFIEMLNKFGPDTIILGADYIDRKISVSGWAEKSDIDVISFISDYLAKGVKYTVCTDIGKDGMLTGPSTLMYKEILEQLAVKLIASGGISSIKDIEDLRNAGCEGAIIGKAVYEGRLTLKELGKLC